MSDDNTGNRYFSNELKWPLQIRPLLKTLFLFLSFGRSTPLSAWLNLWLPYPISKIQINHFTSFPSIIQGHSTARYSRQLTTTQPAHDKLTEKLNLCPGNPPLTWMKPPPAICIDLELCKAVPPHLFQWGGPTQDFPFGQKWQEVSESFPPSPRQP